MCIERVLFLLFIDEILPGSKHQMYLVIKSNSNG